MTAVRARATLGWLSRVTLPCVVALVMTGCSAPPRPHTLMFDITGDGELSSLTYVVNGKSTTERSPTLPWRKTIRLPAKEGKDTWQLKTRQGSGSSEVTVYVDGRSVVGGGCAGDGCSSDNSGSIGD
jgi:hypothetical protein